MRASQSFNTSIRRLSPLNFSTTDLGAHKKEETIEKEYLNVLHVDYEKRNKLMKAKQFFMNRFAKIVQRAYRKYITRKKTKAARVIQDSYRKYRARRKGDNDILSKIKRRFAIRRIEKWYKFMKKRQTFYKKYEGRMDIIKEVNMESFVKIQSVFRGFIQRRKPTLPQMKKRAVLSGRCALRKVRAQTKKKISEIEKSNINFTIHSDLEQKAAEIYIQNSIEEFEQEWNEYESKLISYISKKMKLKDWVPQKTSTGIVSWLNLKTLREQMEHPALRLVDVNKRILRIKAEGKLAEKLKVHYDRRSQLSSILASKNADSKKKKQKCFLEMEKLTR